MKNERLHTGRTDDTRLLLSVTSLDSGGFEVK